MNKQELKKILKPLIKECIKEVIFDDGVLSGIISEVVQGVGPGQTIEPPQRIVEQKQTTDRKNINHERLREQKKKMLDAIGQEAFNGVNLFEGTTPTPAQGAAQHGPLSGQASNDPGVDISSFMGSGGIWKKLAGN
jgi:hypothetical protein